MSERTEQTGKRNQKSVGMTGVKVVSVAVSCIRCGLAVFWATLGTAWLYVEMGQWFVKTLGLNSQLGWILYAACFGILFLGLIAMSLVSAILILAVKVTGMCLVCNVEWIPLPPATQRFNCRREQVTVPKG